MKNELEKKDHTILLKLQDLETQYQRITQLESQLGTKFMLEDKIKVLNLDIEKIIKENKILKVELEDYRYKSIQYNILFDRYNDMLLNLVLANATIES